MRLDNESGMKKIVMLTVFSLSLILVTPSTFAVITTWRGDAQHDLPWAPTWPATLEPFRQQTVTHGVMTATCETVLDVSFSDRTQFEKAWPAVIKLKSPGAPLVLEQAPCFCDYCCTAVGPGVRVFWPSGGTCYVPGGKKLRASAPWPESIKSPAGQLPEYVVPTKETWVPFVDEDQRGSRHRARVDIVLIVDGDVVDLNRIPLPKETPIVDRRFEGR